MLTKLVTSRDPYASDKTITERRPTVIGWTFLGILITAVLVVLVFGFFTMGKAFGRYQKRADAGNQVKVTAIQIHNQEQRVKIAQQKAQIRYVEATGIRRAQDQISGTLTPLYVQHEMISALRESGASTVYIPTDPASGIPVVTTRNAGGK